MKTRIFSSKIFIIMSCLSLSIVGCQDDMENDLRPAVDDVPVVAKQDALLQTRTASDSVFTYKVSFTILERFGYSAGDVIDELEGTLTLVPNPDGVTSADPTNIELDAYEGVATLTNSRGEVVTSPAHALLITSLTRPVEEQQQSSYITFGNVFSPRGIYVTPFIAGKEFDNSDIEIGYGFPVGDGKIGLPTSNGRENTAYVVFEADLIEPDTLANQ